MSGAADSRVTPAHTPLSSTLDNQSPPSGQEQNDRARPPLPPYSPPPSSTASRFDASTSPQLSVLTPPASVPMSAEGSMQPSTGKANQSDVRSEPLPGRRDSFGRRESSVNETGTEAAKTASGKRKLSEADVTVSVSKRQKSDESVPPPSNPDTEDIGPLYGIPTKPYPISRPYLSQDLISLFGLEDTAASVARLDPQTGLKNSANKLRKSYAKHIKDLPGSHEAPKNPGDLMHLLEWPEEMYHAQRRMNKEVEHGLTKELESKLDKALQLAPGKLSAGEELLWQGYLTSKEDTSKAAPIPPHATGPTPPSAPRGYSASTPAGAPSRSRRSGAKRRYDDESFEGYSESFKDDPALANTGDDDDENTALSKRQRRRVSTKPLPDTAPERHRPSVDKDFLREVLIKTAQFNISKE